MRFKRPQIFFRAADTSIRFIFESYADIVSVEVGEIGCLHGLWVNSEKFRFDRWTLVTSREMPSRRQQNSLIALTVIVRPLCLSVPRKYCTIEICFMRSF